MDRKGSTNVRGWLEKSCGLHKSAKLDRLQRQKLDALKTAVRCVSELVCDAAWMQRHDPERKLDDAEAILKDVAEEARVINAQNWERFPEDAS